MLHVWNTKMWIWCLVEFLCFSTDLCHTILCTYFVRLWTPDSVLISMRCILKRCKIFGYYSNFSFSKNKNIQKNRAIHCAFWNEICHSSKWSSFCSKITINAVKQNWHRICIWHFFQFLHIFFCKGKFKYTDTYYILEWFQTDSVKKILQAKCWFMNKI